MKTYPWYKDSCVQQVRLQKIAAEVADGLLALLGEKLRSVILYGSYARDDYDGESDVDIMALADVKDGEIANFRSAICGLSSDVSLENGVTVSIFLKNGQFFHEHVDVLPFYKNVVLDGVVLYER
jgi:predicted nucleotidyltransferase